MLLNLRMDDLDPLLAALAEFGIAIKTNLSWDSPEAGHFALAHDPEGNAVDVWQPPAE